MISGDIDSHEALRGLDGPQLMEFAQQIRATAQASMPADPLDPNPRRAQMVEDARNASNYGILRQEVTKECQYSFCPPCTP
jgi:hypothetical protein